MRNCQEGWHRAAAGAAVLMAMALGGLLVGAVAGCQGSNSGPAVPSAGGKVGDLSGLDAGPSVGNPEQFLMVDCLLPAQVKRLGQQLTFLGPRQPAPSLESIDCEIRGGEYVAYDRADYRTALAVWMETAKRRSQGGDLRRRNLREGCGRHPDYAAAAEWYQRAAERGYGPAQINLGQLAEQGLGVPQDQVVALNWYRRATGSIPQV